MDLTAQTTGKGSKVKANGEFTTSRSAERRTPELSKQSHFEKHGGEFKGADGKPKYKNAEEYAKGAQDFLNNSPKGTLDSDEDCPCCGKHVGYNMPHHKLEHIRVARSSWIEKQNAQWDSTEDQPKGWNKEMALAQIKANVPEEFQ